MTVWLLCAAVAPAEDPEDERPPNPEMQREELVNLEKENARAIKFQESSIFQSPRTPKIFTVFCATEKS